MNLLGKLIPDFLKRLDLDLQRDHPRFWSTRIHYHLWFLLLVNAAVLILGLAIPVTTLKFPDPEALFAYMMMPALIYFAFWVYKVALFTVERRFGIRKPYAEVWEFLIHLVSIALILTIPYNLMLTVGYRIGHLVEDQELVREVDLLNDQAHLFVNGNGYAFEEDIDYGYYRNGSSSHHYFRNLDEYIHRDSVAMGGPRALHSIYEEYLSAYNQIADPTDHNYDATAANYYRTRIDSIEQHFPLYFVDHGPYTPRSYSDEIEALPFRNDSLLELDYIQRMRSRTPPDAARIAEVLAIARTYSDEIAPIDPQLVVIEYTKRKNSTADLSNSCSRIQKINKAKHYGYDPLEEEAVFYVIAITCFMLALLFSIFKNIYWQPFLITLVTGALLPVLILIFALLTEHDVIQLDDGIIMMYCYYWIAVFVITMLGFVYRLKAYNTARTVLVILANMAVPFIALFTLAILHDRWDIFGLDALEHRIYALRDNGAAVQNLVALEAQAQALRAMVARIVQYFLWGGLIGYILLLHPFFRNIYTRLMALPERK